MFDASRYREFNFIAGFIALLGVGQNAEIVSTSANQILNQVVGLLRSYLTAIQCLPLRVRAVLNGVEFDEVSALERRLPGNKEPVWYLGHRHVTWLTGLRT